MRINRQPYTWNATFVVAVANLKHITEKDNALLRVVPESHSPHTPNPAIVKYTNHRISILVPRQDQVGSMDRLLFVGYAKKLRDFGYSIEFATLIMEASTKDFCWLNLWDGGPTVDGAPLFEWEYSPDSIDEAVQATDL